eukprot:Hpha_TRINITY_DN15488_c3_g9::TRINITY_DN15488_c3_g9_i1::g.175609::m.175609
MVHSRRRPESLSKGCYSGGNPILFQFLNWWVWGVLSLWDGHWTVFHSERIVLQQQSPDTFVRRIEALACQYITQGTKSLPTYVTPRQVQVVNGRHPLLEEGLGGRGRLLCVLSLCILSFGGFGFGGRGFGFGLLLASLLTLASLCLGRSLRGLLLCLRGFLRFLRGALGGLLFLPFPLQVRLGLWHPHAEHRRHRHGSGGAERVGGEVQLLKVAPTAHTLTFLLLPRPHRRPCRGPLLELRLFQLREFHEVTTIDTPTCKGFLHLRLPPLTAVLHKQLHMFTDDLSPSVRFLLLLPLLPRLCLLLRRQLLLLLPF